MKDIGQLKAGEKLVVSGAAGSVGTIACQLGKAAGAKVYAIAGGPEKCKWLEQEIGLVRQYIHFAQKLFNRLIVSSAKSRRFVANDNNVHCS